MVLKNNSPFYSIAVITVLIIGILIRVIQFPKIPPGLNQDEASSIYEAYSLAETGKDRWGNKFPAYLPAWGSGQNVLLTYLSVPFVKIMGPTISAARIVSLAMGILTLPLFFFCLIPLGRFPAFLGLLLVALVPWHFMLSRWGLESNLLPFFMLLGCTLFSRALVTNKKRWIVPALLPFALALYAYGTTILVLPFFFALIFFFNFTQIRTKPVSWMLATMLFLLLAVPFILFFIENHLLGKNLPWTDYLFFGTPLLASSRLENFNSATWTGMFIKNINFLLSGFNDKSNYNLMQGFNLLLTTTVPLTILGLFIATYRFLFKRSRLILNAENKIYLVFFAWAIATLILCFTFELNINRFNHFFLPSLVISIWAFNTVLNKLNPTISKPLVKYCLVFWILFEGGFLIRNYFREYKYSSVRTDFNDQLKEAYEAIAKLPQKQVLITDDRSFSYIFALTFLQYPPERFQKEARYELKEGLYKVNNFGRFYFDTSYLNADYEYAYLSRKGACPDKNENRKKILYANDFWEVGTIKETPIKAIGKPIIP